MSDRPNFVVIMSDQHRRDGMGCMGNPHAVTPNLDRLAASGMVFDNFYCNSPLCVPSRMSFLTCKHPWQHQCWTNNDTLSSEIGTFAHSLGIAGYETVLSGRMHMLGPDQLHGFEQRPIGDFVSWLWGGYNLDPVLGPLKDTPGSHRPGMEKSGPGWTGYLAYDQLIRDKTIEWIKARAQNNDSRPFCLVNGYLSPHCPFVCPPEYFRKHFENMTPPVPMPEELHPTHHKWRETTRTDDLTEMETRRTRAAYYGMIEWFDNLAGSVLDALHEYGLMDNTMIIYTSDHGEQAGNHGLWCKSTFYESSAGVPFIASWPEHIPAGTRSSSVASLLDVGATMIDIAGGPELPNSAGRSLKPVLSGDASSWKDEAFSEYFNPPQRMLRDNQWKLNYYNGHEPQLFNLEKDPGEMENLAEAPACRETVKSMTKRIFENWDPEYVQKQIKLQRLERSILKQWDETVHPEDPYQWPKPGDPHPKNYVLPCPEAEQPGVN